MKIKLGRVKKDVTAFGEAYWIQIIDTKVNDNSDPEEYRNNLVTVIIGPEEAIDKVIAENPVM